MNQEGKNWVEEFRIARQGKLIGREILFFEQIDSTNIEARARALQGAPEGMVILAEAQSQGKGRLGRSWISPAGINLYLSVILRPAMALERVPMITLMAGIASAKALKRVTGLEVKIKWPNDLLIQGKKVAGILTEAEPGNQFIILGIGVNVNWPRAEMPLELQATATSLLAEKGVKFSRALIGQELCAQIEQEYLLFLQEGVSKRMREEWED